ncbi:MAG TPA: HAD-IB family hydrolase [Candidatus Limnocylindria bacterium]|nr:HAD-IB family hydrolase [Candidatus Limnocylindria bacterium]
MRRVALFDLDGTMFRGDSIALLVLTLLRRGVMKPAWYLLRVLWGTLLWKLGLRRVEAVKRAALAPLGGLAPARREELLRDFVHEELASRVYPEALDKMRRHASQGFLVLVVSASPTLYLRYIPDILPADAAIGTDTEEDFTVRENMTGEAKVRAVTRWLEEAGVRTDWASSFAYGDSASDLPMLRLTGNHFLVNPKRGARKKGAGIPRLTWS